MNSHREISPDEIKTHIRQMRESNSPMFSDDIDYISAE